MSIVSKIGEKNGQSVFAIDGLGYWTAPAFFTLIAKKDGLIVRYRKIDQTNVHVKADATAKSIRAAIKEALALAEAEGGIFPQTFRRDWFKSEPVAGDVKGWRITVPAIAAKALKIGEKNTPFFFATKKAATTALRDLQDSFVAKATITAKAAARISAKSPV